MLIVAPWGFPKALFLLNSNLALALDSGLYWVLDGVNFVAEVKSKSDL